jgi:phosphoribosylformylglycinamidine cyclo-ligase
LTKTFSYSEAGVDRELRAESKKALVLLKETYKHSRYGEVVQLPYGNIFPFGTNRYLDLVVEGVGTKVLVAQLAKKFNTIGIDGVAMAVNDVIRSGAKPLAIADNIHAQTSDPTLIGELLKGVAKGADKAGCVVPSGEIGDVAELIKGVAEGEGFDIVVASVGEVTGEKVISGRNIKPADAIIGLRSSGVHSNGISLARKILFKEWGGKYDPQDAPEGLDCEVGLEVLKPTEIYVKPLLKITKEVAVKATVHVTGDAYQKFGRLAEFSKNIGFEFDNFSPQPIFDLIQKTASELGGVIADEEMFKTFNMGWGFAVIVDKRDADRVLDIMKKTCMQAEQIGQVTAHEGIRILSKNKKIVLK